MLNWCLYQKILIKRAALFLLIICMFSLLSACSFNEKSRILIRPCQKQSPYFITVHNGEQHVYWKFFRYKRYHTWNDADLKVTRQTKSDNMLRTLSSLDFARVCYAQNPLIFGIDISAYKIILSKSMHLNEFRRAPWYERDTF